MLDVYEHVPRHQRELMHRQLGELPTQDGGLNLTFPRLSHQQRLRNARSSELQPVDEDVTLKDIERLAHDLGAQLRMMEDVSIRNPGDYVHAAVRRRRLANQPPDLVRVRHRLALKDVRDTLIEQHLGVWVNREGLRLRNRGPATICAIAPNRDACSETFIRAHFERLRSRVESPVGGWPPTRSANGAPPRRQRPFARAERRVERRVFKRPSGCFETKAVARFLTTRHAAAALCEYGPTGVACLAACRPAHVPLIVHFHGFDAYDHATIDSFGRSYPELFRDAGAILAVSRHMEGRLLEAGAPREELHYNPYGVETTFFDGVNPASAPPHVLAVGRFVDKKAPLLTILALGRLVSQVAGARLTMIGDGPLLEASRQLVRALRIDDRVDSMAPRPPLDGAAAMRRSRAFVQHSVVASSGDSEGMPVAILAAGASAWPVVVTRHRGIADVGAEQGGVTPLMVRLVGPTGRVESFEPFPPSHARLLANLDLNGFTWVKTHRVGVSDATATMSFFPPSMTSRTMSPSSRTTAASGTWPWGTARLMQFGSPPWRSITTSRWRGAGAWT